MSRIERVSICAAREGCTSVHTSSQIKDRAGSASAGRNPVGLGGCSSAHRSGCAINADQNGLGLSQNGSRHGAGDADTISGCRDEEVIGDGDFIVQHFRISQRLS